MTIEVIQLVTYPIKSTTGISLDHDQLGPTGLRYDRHWALVGPDHSVITAREYPALLRLKPEMSSTGLKVRLDGEEVLHIPYAAGERDIVSVTVFEAVATAVEMDDSINAWFSSFLGTPCRLVHMDERCRREVLPENGGKDGDLVAYADECPLLLVAEESVDDLNSRLEIPVSFRNFRPNILIRGGGAFAEDDWRRIRIGACTFEVGQRCQRCVFTTIDPDTQVKHANQEPLRTLSTYRRHPSGGVAFGVHLIPRQLGDIKRGDPVQVVD